ncbi:uncharacterized protein BYT42DRAFT_563165 [Radiomyces spectabilis]|uniref:uncharacterized protein n=1 Tax=Radiomyces spectabilis TaxID=64574 RepID=UPI0022209248|nr:uncharacterized protein BYT42DRAFT_563165 [Radiomyces spectabilis]KAI8384641.1 hypothetical protein BYT42DRAFT_563165 [Radiomyces spectabilis]
MSTTTTDKYVRGVSFDTMTDKDLPLYSFTLRGKTPNYKKDRRSRSFLVATDLANYSEYALTWASEEIMDDGDELVVLRVVTVDLTDKRANVQSVLEQEAHEAREKATEVMDKIMKNTTPDKKISVIIEFVFGKVQETIQHMIAMYQPSLLIVGTRGLSEFKGMLLGSISKYCLQHSPVPVVVVRPEGKHKKHKAKKHRLSGLMRISSSSNVSTRDTLQSSSDEETAGPIEKKLSRLSLQSFGRRSRSPSPAPPKA